MKKNLALLILSVVLLTSFPAFAAEKTIARANRFVEFSAKADKWADKTMQKMTFDEKIGQLVSIGINAKFWNEDSDNFQELKRQIVVNKVGGVCLFGSPVYEAVHVTNRLQTLAQTPLLISADFEAGIGMRFEDTVNFPWNMAVAATGEPDLARRQGEITAREARALGVHQIFAPVVDVNNNAANPVINVRSYGENPQDVARFADAMTLGIQAGNALATIKHFPGHGDTAVDSHRGLPIIDLPRARFEAVEFVPFKSAIDKGAASVMVSHISLPQLDAEKVELIKNPIISAYNAGTFDVEKQQATIPATLSPFVNTQILRKDLNFKGLIVTDAMDMNGLTLYFNQDEAAVRAFLAGADMILKPADVDATIRGLRAAVQSKRIPEARLNESVKKILATKFELGLTENKIAALADIDKIVAAKPARDLAEEIAAKAITLVRNDALPIQKDKKVFVFGVTNGEDRNYVANTFFRQLRAGRVNFESVVLDERSSEAEISAAIEKANAADIVLAPLFGRVRTGAKNSVGLPDKSAKALKTLLETNKKVVGVAFGNPYLLMEFPAMKTYAVAYGDMPSLQRAAARAILGEQPITGKLPITLPNLHERGTGIQLAR